MTQHVRAAVGAAALGSLLLLTAACGNKATPVATEATSVATPTTPQISVPEIPDVGGGKNKDIVTPSVPSSIKTPTTPTSAAKKLAGPESAGDFTALATTAFKTKFGDYKGLQVTMNFNSSGDRAEVQLQDPTKPANVDAYEFTGGDVKGPTPVKLSGSGSLEENLFNSADVAWDKIPALFDQAKTAIGEIEGSKGVTHFIVQKNLPFDNDTVINIYIDGGPRGDGGYVSFKADGSLKKVYGPSKK